MMFDFLTGLVAGFSAASALAATAFFLGLETAVGMTVQLDEVSEGNAAPQNIVASPETVAHTTAGVPSVWVECTVQRLAPFPRSLALERFQVGVRACRGGGGPYTAQT